MKDNSDDNVIILGTSNLNFGRGWKEQRDDIREALALPVNARNAPRVVTRRTQVGFKVDLLAVQEAEYRLSKTGGKTRVVQGQYPNKRGPAREGVLLKKNRGLKFVDSGWIYSSTNLHGQKIDWRTFPYMIVDGALVPRIGMISVHMPPRRMNRSKIDEEYYSRLKGQMRGLRARGVAPIPAGDFNDKSNDLRNLQGLFGGTWVGSRIDRMLIPDDLEVVWSTEHKYGYRGDDHPLLRVGVVGTKNGGSKLEGKLESFEKEA